MKNIRTLKHQKGLTILELLVAVTLGAIVLTAAVSMQVSSRKSFKAIDNKLTMQTNYRFAYEFISNSLREAGSMGCMATAGYIERIANSATKKEIYINETDIYQENSVYQIAFKVADGVIADFRYQQEILAYDDSTLASLSAPTALVPASNVGSDVIIIKGAIGQTYVFDTASLDASSYASLTIDTAIYPTIDLKPSQYAVMSQCAGAEIFKITGTSAAVAAGTIAHAAGTGDDANVAAVFALDDLTFEMDQSAEIRRVASVAYYVSNNASGVPALFRSIDGVANPVVEGVEQIQILYGVDLDEDNVPDTYQNAASADVTRAITARLSVVMRSTDEVYETAVSQTHAMPGETDYSVTDKYARQVYTTTVTLRNRLTGDRVKI